MSFSIPDLFWCLGNVAKCSQQRCVLGDRINSFNSWKTKVKKIKLMKEVVVIVKGWVLEHKCRSLDWEQGRQKQTKKLQRIKKWTEIKRLLGFIGNMWSAWKQNHIMTIWSITGISKLLPGVTSGNYKIWSQSLEIL